MTKVSIVDFIAKKLKRCIAIVEDGDTASQAIAAGKYVIWKGNPCKASTAISSGDTLSSSNLTALSDGVGNEISASIPAVVNNLTSDSTTSALSAAQGKALNSKTTKLESAISKIAWGATITSPTIAVYGGTATQVNSFLVVSYNDEYIFVKGSVRLVGFARTASNPGVKITLPVATSKSLVMEGLINMNNPSEVMRAQMSANENYLYLFTSESITNQPNGDFIIVVPLLIIQR